MSTEKLIYNRLLSFSASITAVVVECFKDLQLSCWYCSFGVIRQVGSQIWCTRKSIWRILTSLWGHFSTIYNIGCSYHMNGSSNFLRKLLELLWYQMKQVTFLKCTATNFVFPPGNCSMCMDYVWCKLPDLVCFHGKCHPEIISCN